ncbi:MAG: cysteine synthase A [Polyangiaceae bacterium]|nr:cysteine synthase A [Polyangiaceae bacterium]
MSTRTSMLELVGDTPMVRLQRVAAAGTTVLAKLESNNPTGSVKDRAALAMVEAAERAQILRKGSVIVEATSGNMGIALAMIACVRGYRCVLVMPEHMSIERRRIMRAYGAEVVLTPADAGMKGALAEAESIMQKAGNAFMPRQFENPTNPEIHERTTAREILAASSDVAAFVAGVGSGGTITGVARVLKAERPSARIVAVEPENSAVLSGGKPGRHAIQGLGAGFVPAVLDRSLIDEVVRVSDAAAEAMMHRLACVEGILAGISSGANVHAACEVAARTSGASGTSGPVVTVIADDGERYLTA